MRCAEFKRFFLKINDPDYMKEIKLNILTKLITPNTIEPIVSPSAVHSSDVDSPPT